MEGKKIIIKALNCGVCFKLLCRFIPNLETSSHFQWTQWPCRRQIPVPYGRMLRTPTKILCLVKCISCRVFTRTSIELRPLHSAGCLLAKWRHVESKKVIYAVPLNTWLTLSKSMFLLGLCALLLMIEPFASSASKETAWSSDLLFFCCTNLEFPPVCSPS